MDNSRLLKFLNIIGLSSINTIKSIFMSLILTNLCCFLIGCTNQLPLTPSEINNNYSDNRFTIKDTVKQTNNPNNIVKTENNTFILNGKPYSVFGVNYYPQKTPWEKFWPDYDTKIISQDLDKIKKLGFNTFRIFVFYEQFGGADIKPEMKSKLIDILNQAEKRDLKCIVTLFDQNPGYYENNYNDAKNHIHGLVIGLENHPGILAWDIKNEGDLDYKYYPSKNYVVNWVKEISSFLRTIDKNHLITAGWANADNVKDIAEYLDFITFHYYWYEDKFEGTIKKVKSEFKNKPLLLGEFGFHTWKGNPNDFHESEHQYNYFNSILASSIKNDLAGVVVWGLYDFPNNIRVQNLSVESAENYLGIIDLNGNLKPGIKALQQNVFLRDADTGSTIGNQTKNIELVVKLYSNSKIKLVLKNEQNVISTKEFSGKAGSNSFKWSIDSNALNDLLILKHKYYFQSDNVLGIDNKMYSKQDYPLIIRLK